MIRQISLHFITLSAAWADSVTLEQMLNDLNELPKLEVKHHYLGSRLHYINGSVSFHCKKLFQNSSDALPPVWPPPLSLPEKFLSSYTLDGKIPVLFNKINTYWAEKQLGGEGYHWSANLLNNYDAERGGNGVPQGAATYCYGNACCADTIEKYQSTIKDKIGW